MCPLLFICVGYTLAESIICWLPLQTVWTQIKTEKKFDLMFDTLIWYYLIKNSFERVDFRGKSADNKNVNNITLHAKSVYLKCAFNIAVRCETAIKTNGAAVIHLQFWAYGSWDSLFPISMSSIANLWVQKTVFNDKSAILLHPGIRWNKNFASQRQNYAQKMPDEQVTNLLGPLYKHFKLGVGPQDFH